MFGVLIVIWVLAAAAGYLIGERKGRTGEGIALGLLLSWAGVLIIALMPPTRAEKVRRERKLLQIQQEARSGQGGGTAG